MHGYLNCNFVRIQMVNDIDHLWKEMDEVTGFTLYHYYLVFIFNNQ